MALTKKKRWIFADQSDHRLALAVASGNPGNLKIERAGEINLSGNENRRDLLEPMLGRFDGHVGVFAAASPARQELVPHIPENFQKLRQPGAVPELFRELTSLDPEKSVWYCLDGQSGMPFLPDGPAARQLLFCGASRDHIRESQQRLVDWGLVPLSLELSALAALSILLPALKSREDEARVLFIGPGKTETLALVVSAVGVETGRLVSTGTASILPRLMKELGIRDEGAAERMLASRTLDFQDIGDSLLEDVTRELNAFTGSFEIETGQTLTHSLTIGFPAHASWINQILSSSQGLKEWTMDLDPVFSSLGAGIDDDNCKALGANTWLTLLGLIEAVSKRSG